MSTEQELRDVVIARADRGRADVDPRAIDPDADLAEQLDIDSIVTCRSAEASQ